MYLLPRVGWLASCAVCSCEAVWSTLCSVKDWITVVSRFVRETMDDEIALEVFTAALLTRIKKISLEKGYKMEKYAKCSTGIIRSRSEYSLVVCIGIEFVDQLKVDELINVNWSSRPEVLL
jgi:hypothetical protein